MRHDGFALLELLVCMVILSIMTVLTLTITNFSQSAYYVFPSRYTRLKSEALLTGESREYEDDTDMDYPPVRLSENGTVNQARTLRFPGPRITREIVIELGPGALVFRE